MDSGHPTLGPFPHAPFEVLLDNAAPGRRGSGGHVIRGAVVLMGAMPVTLHGSGTNPVALTVARVLL